MSEGFRLTVAFMCSMGAIALFVYGVMGLISSTAAVIMPEGGTEHVATIEGCNVYRFNDGPRFGYATICKAEAKQ